ncbi:HAD-IB family phosphatase [Frateuria sp. GZRe12]|uniref:HAD-IB family phosphatase n=1 Tax=Frateuria sp. GZRe12 TaxID=3351533 RepID=UPI003EDB7D99
MSTAFCFDLDGTISTLEILPCIAAELGVAEEIATLTQLTMDGLIPFTDSMRLRTLILGQVAVERVREIVRAVPLDRALTDFLRQHPAQSFVVTGNLDIWVEPLLQTLGCRWFCSEAAHDQGRLRLMRVLDKGQAVRDLRATGRFDRIVAIGDGANDVPMLRDADVAIAYGGVHAPVHATISASDFVIHHPDSLCTLLKAL